MTVHKSEHLWTTVNSQVLPREAELSCGLFCLIFLSDGVGIVSELRIKWGKEEFYK